MTDTIRGKQAEIEHLRLRAQISRRLLLDAKNRGNSHYALVVLANHHIDNIFDLCKAKGGKTFHRPTADKMISKIR